MISHENVYFTAGAIQRRLGYREDGVIGLFLPLCFDYGLSIFLALGAGSSIYCIAPAMARCCCCIVHRLAAEDITLLPGVPSLFSSLVQMLQEHSLHPLPSLRAITNTGSHLHQSTVDRLRRLLPHASLFLMYGLTECKRVAILLPEELADHPGSVGRPLDGTVAEVMIENGGVATPGARRTHRRGRHVTMGYSHTPMRRVAVGCRSAPGQGPICC